MKIQEFKSITNTFKLDVKASRYAEYHSEEELRTFIADGMLTTPHLHVGGGSNLLFLKDYDGLVLHSGIQGIEAYGETDDTLTLRVGAGVTWDEFVVACVEHNWYGVENLSFIPGEVGAAAVQNIGAYGMEVHEVIAAVETVDTAGRRRTFAHDECAYAYRDSLFKHHPELFVTNVIFTLNKHPHYRLDYGNLRREANRLPVLNLIGVRQTVIRARRNKLPDPRLYGNAGSFFRNPFIGRDRCRELLRQYPDMPVYDANPRADQVKLAAGWLIEQCGWKGKHVGHTGTSDKQSLVLVNYGGATGPEIRALADDIAESVARQFDIRLIPEVNII
jgi:UDP-N-acetylmuramate dehydrogenase